MHEQLNDNQWQQVAIAYLDIMGCDLNNHQYVVIRHHDQPQGHVHIVLNPIGEDGGVHHLHGDRLKTIQATRALEERFDFLSAKPGENFQQQVMRLKCLGQPRTNASPYQFKAHQTSAQAVSGILTRGREEIL